MSAYLVACLSRTKTGATALRGIDIFSEEAPTNTAPQSQRLVCIMKWPGDSYAQAKRDLLAHLQATTPWLLPSRNGGRLK